jgi:hypothetical protein
VSGSAILKISAWGARILHDKNYQFTIFVNWLIDVATEDSEKIVKELKQEYAKKAVSKKSPFDFPNRLWESLVLSSSIESEPKWADVSKIQLQNLACQLTNSSFQVNGKSTFKEEFVTAGGQYDVPFLPIQPPNTPIQNHGKTHPKQIGNEQITCDTIDFGKFCIGFINHQPEDNNFNSSQKWVFSNRKIKTTKAHLTPTAPQRKSKHF